MANACREPVRCLICNSNGHTARHCQVRSAYPSPPKRSSPSIVLHRGSPLLATDGHRPPTKSISVGKRPLAAASSSYRSAVQRSPSKLDDHRRSSPFHPRREQRPRSPSPSSRRNHQHHNRSHRPAQRSPNKHDDRRQSSPPHPHREQRIRSPTPSSRRHLQHHSRSHSRASRSRDKIRDPRLRDPPYRQRRSSDPLRPAPSSARLVHSEDIDNEIQRWNEFVIVVITEGYPSAKNLTEASQDQWDRHWDWKVQRFEVDSFICCFPSSTLRERVCSARNLIFSNFKASFSRWTPSHKAIEVDRPNSLWIELLGLPLFCRHRDAVATIVEGFGTFVRLSSQPMALILLHLQC